VATPSRVTQIIRRFVHLSFERPLLLLSVVAAVGVISLGLAGKLMFRGSFTELLPQSAREVKDLNLVSQKAGGDGYLVVQVKGGSPETLKAFAAAAAPKLEAHPDVVRYVEYRYDIPFFQKRALLLLPREKISSLRTDLEARILYEKKHANPLFVDLEEEAPPPTFQEMERKYGSGAPASEYITSKDGKELYLFVKPTQSATDLGYAQRLMDKVTQTCEAVAKDFPGVSTDYTGAYRIRIEEDAQMKRDLSNASVLSAVIAILLILLATRRGSALLVVGVPVLLGISATFAVTQLTIGHLNVVTGFLVAILIGLGIEYGVHLSMRYWEERRALPAREAMVEAVHGTLGGALASAFTNAAAFFVLLFAKFHAFKQFGFIAGAGVLLTVTSAYLCGPSILALAERIRPGKPIPAVEPGAAPVAYHVRYRRWPTSLIAGIGVVVLAFAVYSVSVFNSLAFESDLRKLKGDSPATRLDAHISQQVGFKIGPAILLVDDINQAKVVTQLVDESRKRHGDKTAFDKVASINDLIPDDVQNRQVEIEKLRPILQDLPKSMLEGESGKRLASFQEMLDAKPYGAAEVPLVLRRRFESVDGTSHFVLLFPRYDLYDTQEIKAWGDQILEVKDAAMAKGVDLHVLDGNLIASRVFELVKGDGPYILWSAALVVFLMIWLSLRSLKKAVIVAGPLFLGMACLAGGMYLFKVNLNFINAVVLPSLLAIAVDNSIHLYHRYEEEGPGSLGHVVRHTGLAALVASISNGAGYGALLIASHQGLRSIGQLAVLGVVCTFLGTTVFFPALLALLERRKFPNGVPSRNGGNVEALAVGEAAPQSVADSQVAKRTA